MHTVVRACAFEAFQCVTYPDSTLALLPDETQIRKSYHVVNANFNFTKGAMQYRLYVDSLTDPAPLMDFSRASGVSSATRIRPRTVGVGIRRSF